MSEHNAHVTNKSVNLTLYLGSNVLQNCEKFNFLCLVSQKKVRLDCARLILYKSKGQQVKSAITYAIEHLTKNTPQETY